MGTARPLSFLTAGSLLVLAALGYMVLILLAIPNGTIYLTALGGQTPTSSATVVALFGPLTILGVLLARKVFAGSIGRTVMIGFAAWFTVAAIGAVLVEPGLAVGIGLTGLLPLALIWYGTRASR